MAPSAANDHHSDTEEAPIDSRAHKRLLDGVNRLNKTQFIKKPTRNEPALRRSEFHLVKPDTRGGAEDAVQQSVRRAAKSAVVSVPDLVRVLNKSSKLQSIGRELKNSNSQKKVLDKPLERPVVERISRSLGYERAKKKLGRWNAVVTRQRAEDHVEFPLKQDASGIDIVDNRKVTNYKHFAIQTDLEKALAALDPPPAMEVFVQQPATEEAGESEQRLSRAEMIARSKEMRLLRIRESQRSAKARMQNKIKSKKFHKILKKEKLKDQLKEFEVLQKQDPEAAMRKLEQLEKHRAEERALLRHKNTGTWAKNLQVRARYDKDVRKELSEQLAISRELTAKHAALGVEDDDEEEEEAAAAAAAALQTDPSADPFNPWLKKGGVAAAAEAEEQAAEEVGGYRKYWNERNANEEALRKWREEVGKPTPIKLRPKTIKSKSGNGWFVQEVGQDSEESGAATAAPRLGANASAAAALDDLFDDAEDNIREKVATKLAKISKSLSADDRHDADANSRNTKRPRTAADELNDLSFKQAAKRPQIDEALAHGDEDSDNEEATRLALADLRELSNLKSKPVAAAAGGPADINPNTFMQVKPKHLQTALPEMEGDHDASDDETGRMDAKRLTIAEAFEDDDIVANFEEERDEERRKQEPADINLTLPGWGSWGGNGIKPSAKRRQKQLILKFPKPEERKPENRGHVIIVDNDNRKLRDHQVSKLPFPYTSVADYEASIRAPIGRDFVPAVAHQLLTKPAVQTQLGAIIEPMREDMLLKRPALAKTKTARRVAELAKEKREKKKKGAAK